MSMVTLMDTIGYKKMIPKVLQKSIAFVSIRAFASLSYLYEVEGESPVTDEEFDELCKFLTDNYELFKPYDMNGYLPEREPDGSIPKIKSGFECANEVCGLTKEYALKLKSGELTLI